MRNFLLSVGEKLKIPNLEGYDDETIKNVILQEIDKRTKITGQLFDLTEDYSSYAELAIRIISLENQLLAKTHQKMSLNQFISSCLDLIIHYIPAENISYMEKPKRKNALILKAASGKIKLEDFKKKIFWINKSLAGIAYKEKNYIYVPDVLKDERFDPTLSNIPIRTVLCVPVKVKGETVGVVNLSHPQPDAFDELQIFYLVSLINLLSNVINLFILYQEKQIFNEKLQKEVNKKNLELVKLNKKLYKETITDFLTKIYNRKFFFQRLEEEFARTLRYGNNFCLLLFDLDHLKQINDKLGHIEGDRLIKLFASILTKHSRKEDVVARIGGDEFGCILIGTNEEGAKKFAERVKEDFKNSYKKHLVTVSGGFGCIGKGLDFKFFKDHKEFFKMVDKALLKAKSIKDKILTIETD